MTGIQVRRNSGVNVRWRMYGNRRREAAVAVRMSGASDVKEHEHRRSPAHPDVRQYSLHLLNIIEAVDVSRHLLQACRSE